MPDNDSFWDFYWEVALQPMQNLGKSEAILSASRLIRRISTRLNHPLRVLEPGCGEGQIVGTLLNSHAQLCDTSRVAGVDYNAHSLERCRVDFPGLRFVEGDFTDPALLASLGKYDLVLLVNALHEVFSTTLKVEDGNVDVPAARKRVQETFAGIIQCLDPGGWLVLFDGLEPPGCPDDRIEIAFLNPKAHSHFKTFASQYQPFKITYRETGKPRAVELSRHDFARYITKSIFLGKELWRSERFESYQYFREDEFREMFARHGLQIVELRTLTVNLEKWQREIEILTPRETFPQEHILIEAQYLP